MGKMHLEVQLLLVIGWSFITQTPTEENGNRGEVRSTSRNGEEVPLGPE